MRFFASFATHLYCMCLSWVLDYYSGLLHATQSNCIFYSNQNKYHILMLLPIFVYFSSISVRITAEIGKKMNWIVKSKFKLQSKLEYTNTQWQHEKRVKAHTNVGIFFWRKWANINIASIYLEKVNNLDSSIEMHFQSNFKSKYTTVCDVWN